jgi:hypothetical protein
MHKVTRHVLEPSGSTFTYRDEDFFVFFSGLPAVHHDFFRNTVSPVPKYTLANIRE